MEVISMNYLSNKKGLVILFGSILIITIGILASCYRDYGLGLQDFDTVLTLFDKEANFGNFSTYAIPDSILHLIPEGESDDLSRDFDSRILSDVVRNMTAFGYTRVDPPFTTPPDVVVLVSATKSDWQGYTYYPGWYDYWGWYPWYPGWGWGTGWGGYYPGYVGTYTFSTASILIEMMDANKIDPDNPDRIRGVWGAGLNGLADDTAVSTGSRITSAINQAFAQSPYLQTQ
jgi:hypothetical protein